MTKKTLRWRAIRQQRRREKARLHKMSKPISDRGHSGYEVTHDKPGFNIFEWLSRPIAEKSKKIKTKYELGRSGGDR